MRVAAPARRSPACAAGGGGGERDSSTRPAPPRPAPPGQPRPGGREGIMPRRAAPPMPGSSNNIVPGRRQQPPSGAGAEAPPAAREPALARQLAERRAAAASRAGERSSNAVPGGVPAGRLAQLGQLDLSGMHHPLGLTLGSAWLLATLVQLAGAAAGSPLWAPALAGALVGGASSAMYGQLARSCWRAPPAPLRVLVTGGSQGIGKALAREFLRCGDRVLVTSRSEAGAEAAAAGLKEEVGADVDVVGMVCDVSDAASVEALLGAAQERLGGLPDVILNNAGFSGSYQSLADMSAEQVEQVVRTNLLGSLLVTRAAMRAAAAAAQQRGERAGEGGGSSPAPPPRLHVFNTEGAGSDGSATPQYAAYGATKAALAQLLRSLQAEAAALPAPVSVHNLSPGMVLTPLLLEGATLQAKQAFNILCEHPETVAAFLVPRVRSVVAQGQSGAAIRYLTPARALGKLLAAPLHLGRYFDRDGEPVFLPEHERIMGQRAKRTQRLQRRAARRSGPLQFGYAVSMALCFWLFASDALANMQLPGK